MPESRDYGKPDTGTIALPDLGKASDSDLESAAPS